MEIANPIYDAAFKYLMQDDRSARLLVGRIAGLEVESLEVRAQEAARPRERPAGEATGAAEAAQSPLALFRLDFAARVRQPDGSQRQVLIEIQKTNAPTAVERFRAYLGEQMCSQANVITHESGWREAVPIVTIYLLGYDLGVSDEAVLDVCPRVTERSTGVELDAGHPFFAGIHHRSHVVQIRRLGGRRRDAVERVLSIFDQGEARVEVGGVHILSVDESSYPRECAAMLRRLHRAAADAEVRRFMDGEDRLMLDSISWGMQAEYHRQRAERAEEETARLEQEAARLEQEAARLEQEKTRLEQTMARSIRHLHARGADAAEIAGALGIEPDDVRRVLAGMD